MTAGLSTFEGKFFVRLVDKNSKHRTQPVSGPTLTIILYNPLMTRIQPAPFMLRHTNNPSLCLGSDRIARLCLQQMTDCGLDTEVFKAHSVRGAAATYLLQLGVPQTLVQAHGFWSSTQTLDKYHPRLHMVLNWDDMLQGKPAPDLGQPPTHQGTLPTSAGNLVPAVVPSPSSGSLEATTEAGKGTDKGTAQQLEQLTALGIVRELHASASCPRCNTPIKREAAHVCATCVKLFHVRCLRKKRDESRKQTRIDNRQYVHSRICDRCWYANVIASSHPNVIDPMGITSPDFQP